VSEVASSAYGSLMSTDELLAVLRAACQECGSITRWATAHGMTQQYVSLVLCGNRKPGLRIGNALGYRCVVVWEPVAGSDTMSKAKR